VWRGRKTLSPDWIRSASQSPRRSGEHPLGEARLAVGEGRVEQCAPGLGTPGGRRCLELVQALVRRGEMRAGASRRARAAAVAPVFVCM
jgi:hypothetical protein